MAFSVMLCGVSYAAVERLSRDFAKALVADVLEGF